MPWTTQVYSTLVKFTEAKDCEMKSQKVRESGIIGT